MATGLDTRNWSAVVNDLVARQLDQAVAKGRTDGKARFKAAIDEELDGLDPDEYLEQAGSFDKR